MEDKHAYPSDAAEKVLVRMPDGMRDRLKEVAKTNSRTMNAEIVARLQSTFRGAEPKHTFDLIEDTAIASDEVLTPELMALVREVATAAAERVVLKVQGFAPTEFGTPRVQQGPLPETATTPKKPSL